MECWTSKRLKLSWPCLFFFTLTPVHDSTGAYFSAIYQPWRVAPGGSLWVNPPGPRNQAFHDNALVLSKGPWSMAPMAKNQLLVERGYTQIIVYKCVWYWAGTRDWSHMICFPSDQPDFTVKAFVSLGFHRIPSSFRKNFPWYQCFSRQTPSCSERPSGSIFSSLPWSFVTAVMRYTHGLDTAPWVHVQELIVGHDIDGLGPHVSFKVTKTYLPGCKLLRPKILKTMNHSFGVIGTHR